LGLSQKFVDGFDQSVREHGKDIRLKHVPGPLGLEGELYALGSRKAMLGSIFK